MDSNPYVVTRQRLVQAPPGAIFELLADPSKHLLIDGSGPEKHVRPDEPERLDLGAEFGAEQRVGRGRHLRNIVVEFEEARHIAWRDPQGHRWRYDLVPAPRGTVVRETWDASRVKRQWTLKVRGVVRNTPVDIERTLDRLADYFDPATPRPAAAEPEHPPKRAPRATSMTPAQVAKREAGKQARADKAVQMDQAAAAAQAAKEQRAAHTVETRAARRVERAEQAVLAREAREARSAAKAEQAAQEERARAQKAADAERAKAEKAEQLAQAERAKAEKAADAEKARNAKAATAEKARIEKAAAAERERSGKAARLKASQEAKVRKQENSDPVEPLPPIGGTAGPLKSAPRRPSRESIAAAKAGRQSPSAPKPKPTAVAPKPKPKPQPDPKGDAAKPIPEAVRTGLPPAAARRLRRAS